MKRPKHVYNPNDLSFEEKGWWYQYGPTVIAVTLVLITSLAIIIGRKVIKEKIVEKQIVSTIIIPDSSGVLPVTSCDDLLEALFFVESRNNDDAFNQSSNAAGCLQIRPIMVEEVNRILEKIGSDERYNLGDRFSRKKSIEMFTIWRLYHHRGHSYEVISRNWNGGPNGYLMEETIGYWHNVKKHLK